MIRSFFRKLFRRRPKGRVPVGDPVTILPPNSGTGHLLVVDDSIEPQVGMYSVLSLNGSQVLVRYVQNLSPSLAAPGHPDDTDYRYIKPKPKNREVQAGKGFTLLVGNTHFLVEIVEVFSSPDRALVPPWSAPVVDDRSAMPAGQHRQEINREAMSLPSGPPRASSHRRVAVVGDPVNVLVDPINREEQPARVSRSGSGPSRVSGIYSRRSDASEISRFSLSTVPVSSSSGVPSSLIFVPGHNGPSRMVQFEERESREKHVTDRHGKDFITPVKTRTPATYLPTPKSPEKTAYIWQHSVIQSPLFQVPTKERSQLPAQRRRSPVPQQTDSTLNPLYTPMNKRSFPKPLAEVTPILKEISLDPRRIPPNPQPRLPAQPASARRAVVPDVWQTGLNPSSVIANEMNVAHNKSSTHEPTVSLGHGDEVWDPQNDEVLNQVSPRRSVAPIGAERHAERPVETSSHNFALTPQVPSIVPQESIGRAYWHGDSGFASAYPHPYPHPDQVLSHPSVSLSVRSVSRSFAVDIKGKGRATDVRTEENSIHYNASMDFSAGYPAAFYAPPGNIYSTGNLVYAAPVPGYPISPSALFSTTATISKNSRRSGHSSYDKSLSRLPEIPSDL